MLGDFPSFGRWWSVFPWQTEAHRTAPPSPLLVTKLAHKKGGRGQEERRPPAALLAAQFSFLRSRDCSFIPSPKADRGGRKDLIREEKRRKRRKKRKTSMLQKARRIENSVPFHCPFLSFFVLPLFSLSASPINKRTREMRETRKENQSGAGVSPSSLGGSPPSCPLGTHPSP